MPTAPLDSLERLGETFALEQPTAKRRMLVIVNPYATTVSDRLRNLVVHALQSRYEVTAFDTQRQGHATELVREAADEGYDVVVAFGGDGTLNEAANGLAGTDVPLTHLPGGSTNVVCKMLGVPGEIVDATEHLLRMADAWRPRRIDLGRAGGRYFVASAGYGLDAAVTRAVDLRPELKHRYGEWYFTWAAVRTFFRQYLIRPPHVELETDAGLKLEGIDAILQNGDPYTYFDVRPLRVAENSSLDSGRLAGAMLHRATPLDVPTVAYRLFSRRHRLVDHRQITGFSDVGSVKARTVDGKKVPLQLDGDWVGDFSEVEFSVRPGALTVVG
ncbi:MAG TPA: diacylglycerol kinase family protein [Solirubrobacteraceae bacterium]|nr:diacylglycerol kinase family protein [Solirubrobacteraceae bacterium]